MSLTNYMKQHAPLRHAFQMLHNAEARKIRQTPILALPLTKGRGFVGTAFDYLARITLSEKFLAADVPVYEGPWIAEGCADRLGFVVGKAATKKWRKIIFDAREEIEETEINAATLPRIIELVQYLAHADYVTRYPPGFDPNFAPAADATADLTALHKVFVSAKGFDAKEICILNPDFASSREVGGADADLVLDTTLIDIKTVTKMEAHIDYMLQLAGYAVLHGRGGIEIEPPSRKPFTHIGIYFARHGQLVTWKIGDLFQHAGFDKFGKMFWEELPRWKHGHVR
jgi:hypothetical protein